MSDAVAIRRHIYTVGMNALVHGAAYVSTALSKELAFEKRGVVVHRDVHYAEREACRLDVYVPPVAGDKPVVLYLHGGGFKLGSKRSHAPIAKPFLDAGFVVVMIDYRLTPRHPFPSAIEDVAEAFLWTVANAGRYGGDASKLVVAGESAGGNLTLALTAMTTRRHPAPYARRVFDAGLVPRVQIPLCGFHDTTRPERYADHGLHPIVYDRILSVAHDYLRGADTQHGLELASPLLCLERDCAFERPLPPTFVSCGSRDPILDDSIRLARALDRRGVPHVLRVDAGEPHAYQVVVIRNAVRRHWDHALEFTRAHL